MTSLLPWLFGLAATLLLLEIAGRRLALWSKVSEAVDAIIPARVAGPATARPAVEGWPHRLRARWATFASRRNAKSQLPPAVAVSSRSDTPAAVADSTSPTVSPEESALSPDKIFEQAKRRARKRLSE